MPHFALRRAIVALLIAHFAAGRRVVQAGYRLGAVLKAIVAESP